MHENVENLNIAMKQLNIVFDFDRPQLSYMKHKLERKMEKL